MKIERAHVGTGAGAWRSLFALAALCGAAAAQTTPEHRVPRPLEAMADTKTEAPMFAKTPAAAQSSGREAPPGEALVREEPPWVALSAPVLDRVHWSAAQAETIWALGASYKCAFATEGATYVPFLGRSAPRNQPLDFRIANVSRGGVPIPFEADVAAVRSGERVSYDRGSFVEVYDLEPAAVEQSFVFERLAGEGDLVVRIAVQGDLTPEERPEGLEFRNDLGAVRYGRATVVDAAGKRASAPTTLASGGIEIRVPKEFLAQAVLPLIVDPLVTAAFPINPWSDDTYSPDVAYDATTHRMITAYEREFSQTDHDVLVTVTDEAGNVVPGGAWAIDASFEDWENPKVANNRVAREFLVVSQVGAVGSRAIVGSLVFAQSLFQSTNFTISSAGAAGEKINPTVGGDPSPTGTSYFCVAWERVFSPTDHDIHARLVDTTGGLVGASSIMVDNTSGTLDQFPSMSKSDGLPPAATQDWTIVWQRHFAAGDEDVFGAQVHWDGGITNSTFMIEGSSVNALNPRVSSITDWGAGSRRYMVVWQRYTIGAGFSISLALRTGPYEDATGDLETLQGEPHVTDKILPAVDTDGSTFALAYTEMYGNGTGDVLLTNVCSAGSLLTLSERKVFLGYTFNSEMRPRIAAEHGSGGAGHGYFIVWDRDTGLDHNIEGARYMAPIGGPVWGFCDGYLGCPCGNNGAGSHGCANSVDPNGGVLSVSGTASLAEDTLVLDGSGMLPNSTCIYLQGSTSSAPAAFGDGKRCVSGTLKRLVTKHNVGGASSFPAAGEPSISVRGQLPMLGATRFYQVWYRDPANYCTATTYNITNGIGAVWTP